MTTIKKNTPDAGMFLNRELNWLEFNKKVLNEAADTNNLLLERVKFLSIFYNNLDEFFMVRVAGLTRQKKLGIAQSSLDGLSATEQLLKIRRRTIHLLNEAMCVWRQSIKPELFASGLKYLGYTNLKVKEKEYLTNYFKKEIHPILTPQALDKGRPFPLVSGESLNFFIELSDDKGKIYYARLKIPDNLPRYICLPVEQGEFAAKALKSKFIANGVKILPIELLIGHHLKELFQGYDIKSSLLFRIIRNTDLEIEEDEADDLLSAVREYVDQRRFGEVIKLETIDGAPKHMVKLLMDNFSLEPFQHYSLKGLLGGAGLMDIAKLDIPPLRFSPFKSRRPEALKKGKSVFKNLKKGDIFLYHPYDSFNPVLDFVKEASIDPKVKAIKQTLYRTGNDSTLIDSLIEARRNGKQVTAVVELKARFDEMRNITWAHALEDAGINIVYGLVGMKIHAKLCLVVREEDDGLKSYVHIGTGNYNPITARLYTDLGLLTAHQEIGGEVVSLFNAMTGLANGLNYKYLLVSPGSTRQGIIDRIERETVRQQQSGDGFIAFKLNQLSDPAIIKALYQASAAGVIIKLQVRGVCCLRPGVPGLSENITVTSLVGRLLEHSRLYYFQNGGADELFIGSADLMPRNLDRRIEVLVPILNGYLKASILNNILLVHLNDNFKTYQLLADGSYAKVPSVEPIVDAQTIMLEQQSSWNTAKEAEKAGHESD